ncbi:hypothetical protein ANANG_G00160130 [Anguilla anguilla]|uniref:Uncharacterized protein n=1 Tax=Anguilla anguilla TaxID=7936 RepID=A0A9D3RYT1_ANGAN|nr:hypothetical protein ANANG_G00160130 [Anguilla anguilla]
MLIEAAKGGHTNVVSYLLDYPNNILSVPAPDMSQLTPPSHDTSQVPRVPFQALAMVVPPQEPDRVPSTITAPPPVTSKGQHVAMCERRFLPTFLFLTEQAEDEAAWCAQAEAEPPAGRGAAAAGRGAGRGPAAPFHPYQPLECIVEETEGKLNELGQRISAIEKAQLQSLELIQGEPLTKDKIEELKKSREEQVQKKKRILKELQKVERQLQLKTQQQFTKEYMEAKGLRDDPGDPSPPTPPRTPPASAPRARARTAGCSPPSRTRRRRRRTTTTTMMRMTTMKRTRRRRTKRGEELEEADCAKLPQPGFVPVQPLAAQQSTDFGSADYSDCTSADLQRALASQQMLGPGLLAPAPDGLMVATPAQTLTDTLDDIMAAVSSRVPMLSTTTSPTPQQSAQTSGSGVSPPSMLPLYPSVDIDAHTESNHDTALTLACAGGHEELVSVLIARGANIEHRDKKGFTPLILAATAGHVVVVEILLDKGGDIEAQSERTKDTPLSLACSGGRQEVVELLLLRGANKEHRNVSDYTPSAWPPRGGTSTSSRSSSTPAPRSTPGRAASWASRP